MAAQPHDTSGGMYAAGESMAAFAAFLVVALVPTVVALVLLRRNTTFWHLVALASVGFAGVGLIAVVVTLVARSTPSTVGLMLLDLVGLAHLLGVPLWTVAFVVFAILASTRPARRLLVAAIGIELVIGVCAPRSTGSEGGRGLRLDACVVTSYDGRQRGPNLGGAIWK